MKNIKPITYSGILVGLNIIFLYMSNILPTGKIFLLSLTTLSIMILLIEFGVFYALTAYASTAIIGLLVIPKAATVAFVAMFGYYGIIKYYIEKLNNIILELVLKVVFFNIIFITGFKIVEKFFLSEINLQFNIWYLIIFIEIGFLIYDYAMSLIVNYYIYRVRKFIMK